MKKILDNANSKNFEFEYEKKDDSINLYFTIKNLNCQKEIKIFLEKLKEKHNLKNFRTKLNFEEKLKNNTKEIIEFIIKLSKLLNPQKFNFPEKYEIKIENKKVFLKMEKINKSDEIFWTRFFKLKLKEYIFQDFEVKISELELPLSKKIKNLAYESKISVEGKVFNIEEREINDTKTLYTILITDFKDSITCKKWSKKGEKLDFGIDDFIRIDGKYQYDDFSKEDIIYCQKIKKINDFTKVREDNEEVKRIELHAHTNMSEMSGVVNSKKLASQIKKFGHKAVAITDFGVVHAYPYIYNASNNEFKTIFGIEAYVVDDSQDMITNPKKEKIKEAEYVIFDIETTGLDPFEDKIIEIGAVKIKNGKKVGKFSELINPEIKIPAEISNITNITDDMVKNSRTIDKVLPEFIEFCKDSIVVAHNARFDVGFIKQKAKNYNLEFDNSVMDTLFMAQTLLTDLKRFGLSNLVNYFNIPLEEHHRAYEDAKATGEVFIRLVRKILDMEIEYLDEMNEKLNTNIKTSQTQNTMILVKNQAGLKTLYELVSRSHLEFFGNRKPRIPKSLLEEKRENFLLASSANASYLNSGELTRLFNRGAEKEEIEERAKFYDYIEIFPVENYNELINKKELDKEKVIEMNKYFYELGKKLNKIVVATGNSHYLEKEEYINRNVLLLGSGNERKVKCEDGESHYKFCDSGLYFKTTKEMLEDFNYFSDEIAREIVIDNTNKINDMIEEIKPIPDGFYPPQIAGDKEEVEKLTNERLKELYGENPPQILKDRVKRELDSIIGNNYAVLYLTAQKLVKKSDDAGYLVGSRGSVGSSIVAFLMGITEVNGMTPHYRCPKCKFSEFVGREGSGVDLPDKDCPNCGTQLDKDGHSIPFEVFMGFNGDKVPDIDLNFSGEYQGEIHKYTEELFGSDNVFRAGTISTLAEKNAFGYTKKYFEETEETTEISKRKAEITRIAKGCEGARKTTGQHAGGMIVLPDGKSIYDFCPVQKPANDMKSESVITHFDYHVMDKQLVKLDILGHDDPTTLKNLNELTGVDIKKIPLSDKKVLSLFKSPEALGVTSEEIDSPTGTSGIPEFGTSFVKQMLVDTKPETFDELVRISGLSHGTDVWLNNAQDYIKNGTATLKEIISVRDDIMNKLIEDGMDKLVAFKIMEFVRKGMPTKSHEKWKEFKEEMEKANIDKWYIDSCEKIKYMFPKGHAVAYVIMALRIAYFKVYYPIEFYTAFLNRKVDDFKMSNMFKTIDELKFSKMELEQKNNLNVKQKQELFLYEILIEMYYRGIELEKADIYNSDPFKFIIENHNGTKKIKMPLIAVDGLGEKVAKRISEERNIEFYSIQDLKTRTKINKTIVDLLKEYDCLPSLPETNQLTLF